MSKTIECLIGLSVVACVASCSGPAGSGFMGGNDGPGPGNGDDDGATVGGPGDGGLDASGGLDGTNPPPSALCGNSFLNEDEACDDGNNNDGDGCAANCLAVTPGYSCNPPGMPCRLVARCGDGSVNLPELCDDGNATPGDGCSDLCKVEIGFKCAGEPLSTCTPTVCGDMIIEGAETCDDGNTAPLDGCDARCQKEPSCPVQGACSSECGDGLVLGAEGCDDGNVIDGDGCSSTCVPEPGFVCAQGDDCEIINGQCVQRVNAIYRDFSNTHPDFQPLAGYACETNGDPSVPGNPPQFLAADKVTPSMVAPTLDAEAKPVWAGPATCATPDSFGQWYRSLPGVNTTVPGTIALFPNGAGGYVNRYGPLGEQYYSNLQLVSTTLDECIQFDLGLNGVCIQCPPQYGAGGCTADAVFDGTPLFFPIDDIGAPAEMLVARLPEQYGHVGWPDETTALELPAPVPHNFHFTTEITYWFVYDPATPAVLNFTGDDDVWVFINGTLAVDLGGIHIPVEDAVTVSEATAAQFGLSPGEAYEVKVFHAERKAEGSSFRLTLTGFNTSRSECRPVCGDGIVGLGEQCDDMVNDSGYGECAPGCVLGEYCGDGIIQAEGGENCDDGNFIDDDFCPASCRIVNVL